MTTFRCKTKKQTTASVRETLHSKHLDMVKHFKTAKKTVAIRKKQQRELLAELERIKSQDDSPEKVCKLIELDEKLEDIRQDISKLEGNEDEDRYYLTNGDLIFQYFQNMNEIANAPTDIDIRAPSSSDTKDDDAGSEFDVDTTVVEKPKSVIDFLIPTAPSKQPLVSIPETKQIVQKIEEEDDDLDVKDGMRGDLSDVESASSMGDDDTVSVTDTISDDPEKKARRGHGLSDFVQRTENFKRAKMLDKYMSNIDPTHVIKLDRVKNDTCPSCETEMTVNQNEGLSECLHCGHSEMIKVDSDKRSYKEASNTEMSYIAYKRINHFDLYLECNSGLKMSYPLVACAA